MIATTFNTGTVFSGESVVNVRPKIPEAPVMPGVVFVHGAGSGASYMLDPYGKQSTKTLSICSRYPAISGDNGGPQTWGNDLSVTRLGGYISALANRSDASDDYALVGDSMGGIVALNYAAQASRKPKAIILTIPVINVEDIRANNRSNYASFVNAAYGGNYNEATMGATKNPYTMRNAEKLRGIPTLIFYGASDQLCLPQYATGYAEADPNFREAVPLARGHEEAAYSDVATIHRKRMMDFLKEHLG